MRSSRHSQTQAGRHASECIAALPILICLFLLTLPLAPLTSSCVQDQLGFPDDASGTWIGRIGNRPLTLALLEAPGDSITGVVLIQQIAWVDTLQILRGYRPSPDSLFLQLDTYLPMVFQRMTGQFTSPDAAIGSSTWRFINDLPDSEAWHASR